MTNEILALGCVEVCSSTIDPIFASEAEDPVPKTRGRQRDFPYFKVQSRDKVSMVWRDARREAFDTEVEARAFRDSLGPKTETRIMRWDEKGAEPLDG